MGRERGAVRAEIQWRADRIVSRGPLAVVGALMVLLGILTMVGATLRQVERQESVHTSLWSAFTRLFDLSSIHQDTGWAERGTSLILVFVGIVVSSTWIALVVTALQASIDRVRNGRTRLHRPPDVVILGWSDQIYTLIHEIAAGTPDHREIAIMSRHPRHWMDDQIERECSDLGGRVTVHCRSGDRTDPRDLAIIRLDEVSRAIVFGEVEDRDDAEVVKSVFAVRTASPDGDRLVIAEVCDNEVAASLEEVFDRGVVTVNSNEILSLVLAQAARDQGMGQLIDQLSSYRGGEFYGYPVPADAVGRPFGELAWRCRDAAPVAFVREGRARVLPAFEEAIAAGDLVVVTDTQRRSLSYEPVGTAAAHGTFGVRPLPPQWSHQRIAVVGWNLVVERAVEHLRGFLDESSEITVVVDRGSMSAAEIASLESCDAVDHRLWEDSTHKRLKTTREELSSGYDAVAVVPYRDLMTPSQSDASTLQSLAVLRAGLTGSETRLVAELRESRSAALTKLVSPDDLLLSDAVTASLVGQMIDRPWLDGVMADLLDFHGSALFIAPVAARMADFDQPTATFHQLRQHVMGHGELSIGVRRSGQILLNPVGDELVIAELTGIVVVGAGIGWGEDATKATIAELRR